MNHRNAPRKAAGSLILGAGLLALLILVNLLTGLLPEKITKLDVSGIGLSEISEDTEKMVSAMKEDVTIYWLCADGIVDDQFELLLTRYEEAGKHIKVEVIDTTENPKFAEAYTKETLGDYSMIVKSGLRHTVVRTDDMYYVVNEFINQNLNGGQAMPLTAAQFEQYRNQILTYYKEDIANYPTVLYFRGEALITAALDYVTRPYIPHAYILTGHGDSAPSETLTELISTMGMAPDAVDLRVAQSVPVDAGCLILFSPATDLSEHEAAIIRDYLNAGGSLMLNTSPETAASCPNLMSVCNLFGLTAAPGIVEEGDASFIAGSRFTLVPSVSTEHTATAYVSQSGYKAQLPRAHAITMAQTLPAGVTATPLMTTSETAKRVDVTDNSVALGTAGKLHVAVAASKSINRGDGTTDTAHLVWYGSADAMTDTTATATSGGNYYYYAATLSFVSEPFVSPYENLSAVNMSGSRLTGLNDGAAFILGAVIVLVIPATLMTAGVVIWVKRKRR
jgi:ABC-2 type transport system permease protein